MTIRPAEESDYPTVSSLFRVIMGENFTLDRDLYEAVCHGENHFGIVAEMEGVGIVGIAVVVVSDRIRLAANTRRRRFHIDNLIVLPDYRRRGIGRALLEHIAERARSEKPSYIIVNCDFTDVAARKTYETAGFNLVRQSSDRFEIAFR